MPLCVGRHLVIRVFLIGITWEHFLKPPDLDLTRGHQPLCGPMEGHLP
jgi:hypothetical protein